MDKTRQHDLQQLRQDYRQTTDPNLRRQMEDAGKRIAREDKSMASVRESLLKEHRRGGKRGVENIKDIHARMEKDYKYRHPKKGY